MSTGITCVIADGHCSRHAAGDRLCILIRPNPGHPAIRVTHDGRNATIERYSAHARSYDVDTASGSWYPVVSIQRADVPDLIGGLARWIAEHAPELAGDTTSAILSGEATPPPSVDAVGRRAAELTFAKIDGDMTLLAARLDKIEGKLVNTTDRMLSHAVERTDHLADELARLRTALRCAGGAE